VEAGEAVKKERERLGMSQVELARAAKVSRKQLYLFEKGENVSLDFIRRIAGALNLKSVPLGSDSSLVLPETVSLSRARAAAEKAAAEIDRFLKELDAPSPPARSARRKAPERDVLEFPPPDAPFTLVDERAFTPWVDVPIGGYVAAGAGIDLLNQDDGETVSIPPDELPDPKWAVLQARGESMEEFGIHDGDIVYVERRTVAANGEIVIGWLSKEGFGEGLVIKKWHRRGGKKMLISGNPQYEPVVLEPGDVWELQAIVRKVVKRQVRTIDFTKISG